jgi:hypothetical protein
MESSPKSSAEAAIVEAVDVPVDVTVDVPVDAVKVKTARKVPPGFKKFEGSRAQVMNGTAYKTARGEKEGDLVRNERGSIVNKAAAAKAQERYWEGVADSKNPLAIWSAAVAHVREKYRIQNFELEKTFAKGSEHWKEARAKFDQDFRAKTPKAKRAKVST